MELLQVSLANAGTIVVGAASISAIIFGIYKIINGSRRSLGERFDKKANESSVTARFTDVHESINKKVDKTAFDIVVDDIRYIRKKVDEK